MAQITWKNIAIPSMGSSKLDRYGSVTAQPSPLNPGFDAIRQIFKDQQEMAEKNRAVTIENNDMELARQVGQIKDLGAFNQMRDEGQLDPNALQSQVGRWATPEAFETALNKHQGKLRGTAVNEATPFALDAAKQSQDFTEGETELVSRLRDKGMAEDQIALNVNQFREQNAYLDNTFKKQIQEQTDTFLNQVGHIKSRDEAEAALAQAAQLDYKVDMERVRETFKAELGETRSDKADAKAEQRWGWDVADRKKEQASDAAISAATQRFNETGDVKAFLNTPGIDPFKQLDLVTNASLMKDSVSKLNGTQEATLNGLTTALSNGYNNILADVQTNIDTKTKQTHELMGFTDPLKELALEGTKHKDGLATFLGGEEYAGKLNKYYRDVQRVPNIGQKEAGYILTKTWQDAKGSENWKIFGGFNDSEFKKLLEENINSYLKHRPLLDEIASDTKEMERMAKVFSDELVQTTDLQRNAMQEANWTGKPADVAALQEKVNARIADARGTAKILSAAEQAKIEAQEANLRAAAEAREAAKAKAAADAAAAQKALQDKQGKKQSAEIAIGNSGLRISTGIFDTLGGSDPVTAVSDKPQIDLSEYLKKYQQ